MRSSRCVSSTNGVLACTPSFDLQFECYDNVRYIAQPEKIDQLKILCLKHGPHPLRSILPLRNFRRRFWNSTTRTSSRSRMTKKLHALIRTWIIFVNLCMEKNDLILSPISNLYFNTKYMNWYLIIIYWMKFILLIANIMSIYLFNFLNFYLNWLLYEISLFILDISSVFETMLKRPTKDFYNSSFSFRCCELFTRCLKMINIKLHAYIYSLGNRVTHAGVSETVLDFSFS